MIRFLGQVLLILALSFNTSLLSAKEKSEEETREDLRKMVEEKKKDLNGSSWDINIKSQSGKAVLEGADELVFQDGKFTSKKMSKKGYASTNYTITPSETGPSVWETMQTSADDGVIFWRGEWLKDSMSGVVNRQAKEGTEDYYFSSSAKARIPPTSEGEVGEGEGEVKSSKSVAGSKTLSSIPEESDEEEKQLETEASKLI